MTAHGSRVRRRRIGAVALALLAVAQVLPVHGQPGVQADLAIVSVQVVDAVYDAETPATVVVTIHNHGPGSGSGVLRFGHNTTTTPLTGDSRSDQPFNITSPLPAGRTTRFRMPWSPSRDQTGAGTVHVVLSSASDPNAANNVGSASVFVRRYAFHAVLEDTMDQATFPGRSAPYRIAVTNAGNAPANLTVSATGSPDHWSFQAPLPSRSLALHATSRAIVLVAPGAGALEGDVGTAAARLSFVENPRVNSTLDLPNTTATRSPSPPFTFGVALDALPSVVADPAVPSIVVGVEVTNTGNVADAFNVSLASTGALAEVLHVSTPDGVLALGPGERTAIPLFVRLAGDPSPEDVGVVRVRLASINTLFEPDAAASRDVEIRVAAPDLVVADVRMPERIYQQDDAVTVAATIRNAGQRASPPSTLQVTVGRSGFALAEVRQAVDGLPPESDTVVQVPVPVREMAGAYDIDIVADADQSVRENREENNRHSDTAFVRTTGLTVRPAVGAEGLPGQFLRYEHPPHSFEVRNTGNARETVQVHVESEHGWVSLKTTMSIPPTGVRSVPISFTIPGTPGTEVDNLEITATLVNVTSVQTSATTQTRVVDHVPPRLEDLEFPSTVTATRPFTITSRWTDAIGVGEVTLFVVSPSNVTKPHAMTGGDAGTFTVELTLFELGRYGFWLEATDASSNANRFVERDVHGFTATYTDRPDVRIVQPDTGRPIRAGTPIVVAVSDAAGLRSVSYQVGEAWIEIVEPFHIPTGNWTSGEHDMAVRAINRYDLETVVHAVVTVDNEPPRIDGVSFTPAKPASGEQTTVRVATADGAAAVVLRIRDQTGYFSQHDLAAAGGGVFAGTFALPAGEYLVAATATDAAGNAASSEHALVVGGRGVPAAPAALVLAVLLGMATLARRPRERGGRRSR